MIEQKETMVGRGGGVNTVINAQLDKKSQCMVYTRMLLDACPATWLINDRLLVVESDSGGHCVKNLALRVLALRV